MNLMIYEESFDWSSDLISKKIFPNLIEQKAMLQILAVFLFSITVVQAQLTTGSVYLKNVASGLFCGLENDDNHVTW